MNDSLDRARLDQLFAPRSVAFIGASDKSGFSAISYGLVRAFGATDRTHLINPNSATVHGARTYARCEDVPGGIDCAYVMVPRALVLQAIDDAAAAGARSAVVLSAGYAETGPDGAAAQLELVKHCEQLGITMLGPNILGFGNVAAGIVVCALPGLPVTPGQVALVSQSGAGAGSLTRFVATSGIRLSYAVTTGNEAMVTAEDVVNHVLDDENTRAVAVFAETFRKPELFLVAVRKAAALRKAIVVLKAGSSELSARTAAAHTGALVGDDSVIDAVLRQEGVIRVQHMEDMLHTANLAAFAGPWRTPGVGVVSLSGGACDIIADRAEELGLALPALGAQTEERLRHTVSALGQVQNPLDVTGAGVIDPSLLDRATAAMGADPQVGFVAVVGGRPTAAPMPGLGAALAQAGTPGAYVATVSSTLDEQTDATMTEAGLLYIPSIRDAVGAMAKVSWWSTRLEQLRLDPVRPPQVQHGWPALRHGQAVSELEVRRLLARAGVPVVPGTLVSSAEQAAAAAAAYGTQVALKVVSPDIAHKSDIGCVRLDLEGQPEVAAAYASIVQRAGALPGRPQVDGVLVSPMRRDGVELIVGVARVPDWGLVLTLGLGGIFVEVLKDVALLRLPATDADIARSLRGLRGAGVLQGARNRPAADLPALVDAIGRVADLAAAHDDVAVLEVNPLWVRGSQVEALDGLIEFAAR